MLRPKCIGKLLDEDKTLSTVFLGVYTEFFLHKSRTFERVEDIFSFSFFFWEAWNSMKAVNCILNFLSICVSFQMFESCLINNFLGNFLSSLRNCISFKVFILGWDVCGFCSPSWNFICQCEALFICLLSVSMLTSHFGSAPGFVRPPFLGPQDCVWQVHSRLI